MPRKKAVCVDFDGVIATYDGRRGPGVVGDLIAGTVEGMTALRKAGFKIYVLSARADKPGGVQFIEEYLREHGVPFDVVTNIKVPAVAYIDDRAVVFYDNWYDIPTAVEDMERKKAQ